MARTTAGNEESSDAVRSETKKESSDQTEHGVTNTQEKNVDEGIMPFRSQILKTD